MKRFEEFQFYHCSAEIFFFLVKTPLTSPHRLIKLKLVKRRLTH